jgi:uncharacterized RDD family membrane protein YckC
MHQKGFGELSKQSSQPAPKPSWKQEVNRRLEEHKSRKGISVVDEHAPHGEHAGVSDRAAKAAARVAARFSKAPSYSDMQAAEVRAALRDAEAATRVALEAQAAAQVALANLERARENQIEYEEEKWEEAASAAPAERTWDASDESARACGDPGAPTAASDVPQSARAEDWHFNGSRPDDYLAGHFVEAQPIHANLIHFPREIVATRRVRPRAMGVTETSPEQAGQLSIFEVDPNSISIAPMASASTVETAAPAPSWSGSEWSNIELETQSEDVEEYRGNPPSTPFRIELAPLELRLMAATIDFALTVGLVCAGAVGIAGHMAHSPAIKAVETSAFVALLLIGALYQAFFLMTTMSTPGMMYAGISLCTFDDENPTRAQLRDRLGALVISLLPVGLGFAWAIFDEDRLSWHDRISRTYQRKC